MIRNARVRQEVAQNIEKYEGRIPHLYLDTEGNVTVGVGHLIPDIASMDEVPLYRKDELVPANSFEKQEEYKAIKGQPFGRDYPARYYQAKAVMFMRDDDISAQRDQHIQTFYWELKRHYTTANGFSSELDDMPEEVQLALFDMVFNLGITKLRNQYIRFNDALKAERWKDAAAQSNRLGIQPGRNQYVRTLLMTAATNKQPPR